MKKIFGVAILLGILGIIGSYKMYTKEPFPPEIAEEDYLILGDEPPFQMKSLPEEEVEVTVDQETAEQLVELKEEGFSLKLPSDLRVVTREVEPGRILIYRGEDCRASLTMNDELIGISIEQWLKEDKVESEFMYDLLGYSYKKIPYGKIEAYEKTYETVQFGIEKSIIFKWNDRFYFITKFDPENTCLTIYDVFNALLIP
ncbi:MAG: hypothetical protein AB7J40_02375 [Candidatus Altimarinota bacterium]